MVRPWLSALAWLAAASASSTLAAIDAEETVGDAVAGAFIIECKNSQQVESLAKAVLDKGGEVRHTFDSEFFRGVAVQLANVSNEKDKKTLMEGFNTWPVLKASLPVPNQAGQAGQAGHEKARLERRATEAHWAHVMTQVDKLHEKGFTGNGIKIAMIDSGVNYTHPALGGCFGKGCRVAYGDNFSPDGTDGDPMDCKGHGTMVAGVLAGYLQTKDKSFVGAAPNATIMAYRAFDCQGETNDADYMKAWERAAEDGAQIILSSSAFRGENWAQSPRAILISRIAAKGIPCIAGIGNHREAGLFNAGSPSVGRNVLSVNSFSQSKDIDGISAYGPTWSLDIKPNLGAPGGRIPVTRTDGGYGVESGTSLSGPLVAGIIALVGQARGGVLDTTLASSLLVSTARPQRYASGGGFITVAQQGGGLVSAWDAAYATTLVEPHSLAFNDTDHRASVSFLITNTAKSEVTYQLAAIHATTLYTLKAKATIPTQGEPVQGAADVKLSQSSVTLGPGKSETIHVSATDPSGLDRQRLPIWSGWIAVNGTDGESLTIPYLGLAGSLNSVASLNPATQIMHPYGAFIFKDPPNGQLPGPSKYITKEATGSRWQSPWGKISRPSFPVQVDVLLGSPEVRIDIVPLDFCSSAPSNMSLGKQAETTAPDLSKACVPDSMVTEFHGVKSIGQVPGFPKHYISRQHPDEFGKSILYSMWDGSFAPDQYAPPGRYKLVVRALSPTGDAANASHWQTMETDAISIFYEHNVIP